MTTTSTTSLSPVLITGGCGLIGFHLFNHILESEPTCEIHVLDINTIRNRVLNVTYHTCDINSLPGVESVMLQAQPRTIFHFAYPDSMVLQPSVFQKVNVNGAQNLISAALKVGTAQAFVNTSTSSVIHDNISDLIDADEDLPDLQYSAQSVSTLLLKRSLKQTFLPPTENMATPRC